MTRAEWLNSFITWQSVLARSVETIQRYQELAMKHMSDADGLLRRQQYVEASEKLWGAAAEMTKFVAATRGLEVNSKQELWKFVTDLRVERRDPELVRLFHIANNLHHNFDEGILTPEAVRDGAEAVQQLVARLRRLA